MKEMCTAPNAILWAKNINPKNIDPKVTKYQSHSSTKISNSQIHSLNQYFMMMINDRYSPQANPNYNSVDTIPSGSKVFNSGSKTRRADRVCKRSFEGIWLLVIVWNFDRWGWIWMKSNYLKINFFKKDHIIVIFNLFK